ncbi:hypothetical protein Slin14017_G050010 [Septoria linicola]|nr:hypothetical protein Slin14017_G050010 [Septoria linicola]
MRSDTNQPVLVDTNQNASEIEAIAATSAAHVVKVLMLEILGVLAYCALGVVVLAATVGAGFLLGKLYDRGSRSYKHSPGACSVLLASTNGLSLVFIFGIATSVQEEREKNGEPWVGWQLVLGQSILGVLVIDMVFGVAVFAYCAARSCIDARNTARDIEGKHEEHERWYA